CSLWLCLLLIGLGILVFFLLRRQSVRPLFCGLLLVFALGISYGELRESLRPENPFQGMEEAVLCGEVAEDPIRSDTALKFRFEVTEVNGEPLAQTVNVTALVSKELSLDYGDVLELKGSFLSSEVLNPGGFDYRAYQKRHDLCGTFSTLYTGEVQKTDHRAGNPLLRFAYGLKHRFERSLSYLPSDQAVLIRGIFFGDTSGLDTETADVLTKSGIRHCFAVSGLHVGYALLFLNGLGALFRLGRKGQFLMVLSGLFLYAAMTGFSPSVLRASVMCLMVLGAGVFGREKNSFNGFGAAAILLLLWDPDMLLQPGFQLSFIAMFSILFFMPWLETCVPWSFPGKGAILVTVAAQMGMIPVLAYMFHVVSLVSFFISTVCCLLVGGMVLLCFAALFLSLVSPFFGAIFLIPCGLLGKAVITAASSFSELPFAYLYKGDFGLVWLILIYVLLALIVCLPPLRSRRGLSVGLAVALFIVFLFPVSDRKDELEITFLAVGEGDAIYLHTPEGEDIMIDAGDAKGGDVAYYTIRPFLLSRGVDDLERVILSHNDDDHSGAVPYLAENFPVEEYVLASAAEDTYADLLALAAEENSEVTWVKKGDVIDLGGGVSLEVLWPEETAEGEDNELSMVLRLTYGDFSALFTGDIEGSGLGALVGSDEELSADLLKIPHHGSKNSYDEDFYRAADPDAVVISVGKNSYGHPADQVISYWERHYADVYRTDEAGAVTVTVDSTGYDITPYRSGQK
ncbi:MAG: DNA internalization-related competence protein ComEC/Rec2, partial [Clostridia bacterium]